MNRVRTAIVCALIGLSLASTGRAADAPPVYKDPQASLDARVDDLFSKLTSDEKLSLLSGTGFATVPIPRLGVPEMMMADAAQGVRGGMKAMLGPATAFPCGSAMAASWDTDLINRVAHAIGEEAANKGTGAKVLLGPAVNIQRVPTGGRDSEYLSEDPYLAARLAVAYVQGMQSSGTSACVKHYACNNSEINRMYVNEWVGERALREIYLPAFEAAVKDGKAWAIMSAYNKVNGPHCSANEYLLTDVLKKGWGFDGVVMSDWGGVHQTDVAQFGNDLEMPGKYLCTVPKLKEAMAAGKLTQPMVDDAAKRVIKTVIRVGLLDAPLKPDHSKVDSPEHQALALEAATKGLVLLKNQGNLLPIDRKSVKSIVVLGRAASDLQINTGGSADVKSSFVVEPIDGIRKAAGDGVKIDYVVTGAYPPVGGEAIQSHGKPGFAATFFKDIKLEGQPIAERTDAAIDYDSSVADWPGVPKTNFSARWTADLTPPATGTYTFSFTGDDAFRVMIDGQKIIDSWKNGGVRTLTAKVDLQQGKVVPIVAEFYQAGGDAIAHLDWQTPGKAPYAKAAAVAKNAELAIVVVGSYHNEHEGDDRESMDLPEQQDELIKSVVAANPKTIVVLSSGSPVTMANWVDAPPAILQTWFPGEQAGTAIAAVLFGDANPSGKLPMTFAKAREDYPDFGHPAGPDNSVQYLEGIYVGYRHFDKEKIEPVYPFGYGLSYTTFEYSNVQVQADGGQPKGVTVDVKNTGKVVGDEVVELYVHDPHPQIDKPVRELKGFAKVSLQPGESKPVTIALTPRDFAYFDVAGKQWRADAGEYELQIGASSRDIRQTAKVTLAAPFTDPVPLSHEADLPWSK